MNDKHYDDYSSMLRAYYIMGGFLKDSVHYPEIIFCSVVDFKDMLNTLELCERVCLFEWYVIDANNILQKKENKVFERIAKCMSKDIGMGREYTAEEAKAIKQGAVAKLELLLMRHQFARIRKSIVDNYREEFKRR